MSGRTARCALGLPLPFFGGLGVLRDNVPLGLLQGRINSWNSSEGMEARQLVTAWQSKQFRGQLKMGDRTYMPQCKPF